MKPVSELKICVIGLGYVGLSLARLFATRYSTVGFDLSTDRVAALMGGHDDTHEVSDELLAEAFRNGFKCTSNPDEIRDCNFYIIAVPTPVDQNKSPDLKYLCEASYTVGRILSHGNVVVYESTVYPGVTEEKCVPILAEASGLQYNEDFFVGYSPERINPGDREHTVEKIKKVTSGSTPETAAKVDAVYASVIEAGTHLAPSIRVAEAAKVIENAQRDINIAFVNELSKIFTRMDIDTREVLRAAATKWNFLPFKPGLVGGHCIGVDPYYLAQCAQRYGYNPEIILTGRRMNDGMGEYVAGRVVKLMIRKGIQVKGCKVLILGFTFKENCSDVRNTRVIDIVKSLWDFGCGRVDICDPKADSKRVQTEYHLALFSDLEAIAQTQLRYDAIVLAVAHDEFLHFDLKNFLSDPGVIFDVQGVLISPVDGRL